MSITGKVDAMMGGLRRENNALRKNYERERTRTTVLESRILHAFLAAVHAELPCPFCGAETNYVSPFARHIGDCIVETIELAVASPPSVSEPKYTKEEPLKLSYRELRPSDACTLCHGSGVRVAEDDPRRHVYDCSCRRREPEETCSETDSLHRYGVMTEHLAQLAAALGLREGKHTADSVARIAIERLVLAPRSETALRPGARVCEAGACGDLVRRADHDPRGWHVRWPNGTITTVREESLVLVATPTGSEER